MEQLLVLHGAATASVDDSFSKGGLSLADLDKDKFIARCGGAATLAGKTTEDVCMQHVKPLTAQAGMSASNSTSVGRTKSTIESFGSTYSVSTKMTPRTHGTGALLLASTV